jgi:seryl-tRNA synthetase
MSLFSLSSAVPSSGLVILNNPIATYFTAMIIFKVDFHQNAKFQNILQKLVQILNELSITVKNHFEAIISL